MFTFFLWLLAFSNLAFASELMTLLKEGARIESEAPYGYSFNSLSYREGHLVRTPTQGHYEYFNDPLNTDAERLKLALKEQALNLDFGCSYDPKKQYWEGFCHQGAEASIYPNLHHSITSTKGLVCPTASGTGVILSQMTLRELLTYMFYSRLPMLIFGRREHSRSSDISMQSSLFGRKSLNPHEFHEKGHLALRNKHNFVINVGPSDLVFNRVVKSMISRQEQIFDSAQLEKLKVPATHFPDQRIVYHVNTDVHYYDYADFHESGGIYEWSLEYYIFVDPKNLNKVESIWIGPSFYNVEIERNHNKDTYTLTKQPDFMWMVDWSSVNDQYMSNARSPSLIVFEDLFSRCVQLEEAEQRVKKALSLTRKIKEALDPIEPLRQKKLDQIKQEIHWFPLKSEVRDELHL
jgi:hypothetical protein